MNIYEVQERTPALLEKLVSIWEESVRATHLFLTGTEIERIREHVPEALAAVQHLVVAENRVGEPIGFMGVERERLEMLFLSPQQRGKGMGRQLLERGFRDYGLREVTVNEQNPRAAGFYRHFGFEEYKRTACDEQGGPYPLLYMRRGTEV